MAAAGRGLRRRLLPWRRPPCALAAAALLLALARSASLPCFVGHAPRTPHTPGALRGRRAAATALASGAAEETLIPEKRAISELDLLLNHVYRPKREIGFSLLEFDLEERDDEAGKTVRATVTIVPSNRTFTGRWAESGAKAKISAAQKALSLRLGDNELGDAQAALSQILRNDVSGKDISTEVEEKKPGWRCSVRLPAQLFARAPPRDEASFVGKGKSRGEARQSAARKALAYLLASAAALPALAALDRAARKSGALFGHGSRSVNLGNLPPEADEEAVRGWLGEFGEVEALELKSAKSKSRGTATYGHSLSAWAASRMLDRSAMGGHVVFVAQTGAKVKGAEEKSMSWGEPASPDSVLLYKNAPFSESWTSMLERFREVVDVTSFRYWVDPETKKSRGYGTIGFSSPAAAREALERLQGMEIEGRKLKVEPYEKRKRPATG